MVELMKSTRQKHLCAVFKAVGQGCKTYIREFDGQLKSHRVIVILLSISTSYIPYIAFVVAILSVNVGHISLFVVWLGAFYKTSQETLTNVTIYQLSQLPECE